MPSGRAMAFQSARHSQQNSKRHLVPGRSDQSGANMQYGSDIGEDVMAVLKQGGRGGGTDSHANGSVNVAYDGKGGRKRTNI